MNSKIKFIISPSITVRVKNANTKDNNNGAEQPLTIEMRLERGQKKPVIKNPLGKKAGNLGRNHGSCSGDW